jgi:hypothetical protein
MKKITVKELNNGISRITYSNDFECEKQVSETLILTGIEMIMNSNHSDLEKYLSLLDMRNVINSLLNKF